MKRRRRDKAETTQEAFRTGEQRRKPLCCPSSSGEQGKKKITCTLYDERKRQGKRGVTWDDVLRVSSLCLQRPSFPDPCLALTHVSGLRLSPFATKAPKADLPAPGPAICPNVMR